MSYENLHIYRRDAQPATEWVDQNGPEDFTVRWPARKLLWCRSCRKRRHAENCVVYAYYDHISVSCAPDKGCKSEAFHEAKRRREFRNRSRGQKRRFRKVAA